MSERVAIVGSRAFADRQAVRRYVWDLPRDTVVISGGAAGVDSVAEKAARDFGLACVVHAPDYDKHGKRAPLVRNKLIAKDCDRMVAFWDGKSTGTAHAINCAKELDKPVEVR